MSPSPSTSSSSTTSWPSPSRPRNPQQVTSPPPDEPRRARYVVIGAAGQLGFDLVRTFDRPGEVVALTRRELDVLDAGRVRAVLADLRPTCVVNTAAYNRVGLAKSSGKGGTNFVETMLSLARRGEPIRVVADQVLGPSYTRDLALKIWRVLPRAAHPIYHLTNAGQTSWHGVARRVFELAGVA